MPTALVVLVLLCLALLPVDAQGYYGDGSASGASVTCAGSCECPGTSGEYSGTITDGPDNYPSDAACQWTIQAAPNTPVSLQFTFFDTEGGYDYVHVYNCVSAACDTKINLVTLDGAGDTGTIYTSSTGYMMVELTSDGGVEQGGFEASWSIPGSGYSDGYYADGYSDGYGAYAYSGQVYSDGGVSGSSNGYSDGGDGSGSIGATGSGSGDGEGSSSHRPLPTITGCPAGLLGAECRVCISDRYTGGCAMACEFEKCSRNGRCSGMTGECICFQGWTGKHCNTRSSDSSDGKGLSAYPSLLQKFVSMELLHCAMQMEWASLATSPDFRKRFRTGGLGSKTTDEFKVWLCDRFDACVPRQTVDMMCYAFNEVTRSFVPLNLNSKIKLVKRRQIPSAGSMGAQCEDDPMGYVASDPSKDCSMVDVLGGWWACADLDPDFNGVKDIHVWQLCPKSCNKCA